MIKWLVYWSMHVQVHVYIHCTILPPTHTHTPHTIHPHTHTHTYSSSQYVRSMLESPDEGHAFPIPSESQNVESFEKIYLESTFDVVRSITWLSLNCVTYIVTVCVCRQWVCLVWVQSPRKHWPSPGKTVIWLKNSPKGACDVIIMWCHNYAVYTFWITSIEQFQL